MHYVRFSLASIPVLLLALFLIVQQFAQPPTVLKPRVFVIGLSKTGTTSIGDALSLIGYRKIGWRDVRSRHMVYTWANGDINPLIELTRRYEAFEDLPWPQVYKEMAEMYPDAKFILSLRKNEETWMRSMEIHVGRGRWIPHGYIYGADTYYGNEDIFRHSYRNHTENVRNFFRHQPDRLVELTIDDGDRNWDVLCRFTKQCPRSLLGFSPSIGFPKSNTAASWDRGRVAAALRWCWGWTITRLEEQTASYYYDGSHASVRHVLGFLWKMYNAIEQVCYEVSFLTEPFISPSADADLVAKSAM